MAKTNDPLLTQVDKLYVMLQHKQPFDGMDAKLSTLLLQYLYGRTGRYTP